ncbi:MAG: AAA family ATPase [Patescibacteria group bacterium]
MRQSDEFERRWIVLSIDPDIRRAPSILIEQAYLGWPKGLRIRISTTEVERKAEATKKTGHGLVRLEQTVDLSIEVAEFFFDCSPFRIKKRRYHRDGWEIDYFEDELSGLVTAEFELTSPNQDISLPPWIHSAVEVTNSVTNMQLARMAHDLRASKNEPLLDDLPVRDRILIDRPRIVLTGGPCSGKSTAIERLRSDLSNILQCVPETATIIIDRVGAKPPLGDIYGMRKFQRTVHRVQCGFEEVSLVQALGENKQALLLDRGTIDGAAYLNGGVQEFECVCLTDASTEYSRYSAVIILDVPPQDVYDAKKDNNAARGETYEQAAELGERIVHVWSGHPNVIRISNHGSFEEKYAAIRDAVERILKRD